MLQSPAMTQLPSSMLTAVEPPVTIPSSAVSGLLNCQNLTVQRSEFPLCEGVNLTLKAGDICHLIGENGTGKTTFIMQLAGLIPIIEGEIFWQGKKSLPIQPLFIAHQIGIHLQLTVEQNLRFLLALYGITPTFDELDQALDWVGLAGYEAIPCYQLSAGQTRRVGLTRLWFGLNNVQSQPFWLLDEPLTALDVNMIAKIETLLQDFANRGGAVLLTSHQAVGVANKQLDLTDYMV
ncbi:MULTISPECIES: heme ABC exporter ATP-binding protein CcmA [unclassified Moraxella]|uniref:heme ABC exporter ATP-binding protein CcmA n=1 Tax=unclassified Moraxella TaxID=2685852 RepID=UPI003AF5E1EC